MHEAGHQKVMLWDKPEGWGGEGDDGTHVHPWLIHVNVWQNHYNILKQLTSN